MKFQSLDGEDDFEHDGVRLLELPKIFMMQNDFFRNIIIKPFDRIQNKELGNSVIHVGDNVQQKIYKGRMKAN